MFARECVRVLPIYGRGVVGGGAPSKGYTGSTNTATNTTTPHYHPPLTFSLCNIVAEQTIRQAHMQGRDERKGADMNRIYCTTSKCIRKLTWQQRKESQHKTLPAQHNTLVSQHTSRHETGKSGRLSTYYRPGCTSSHTEAGVRGAFVAYMGSTYIYIYLLQGLTPHCIMVLGKNTHPRVKNKRIDPPE